MNKNRNLVAGLFLLLSCPAGALLAVAPSWAQSANPSAPSAGAAGQKAASPAKPVSNDPETQTTTATFGDWVLRCQKTAAPARRICEVLQSVMIKAQSAPFAQIVFGKPTPTDALHLTVAVPINISLPSSVRVAADEKDQQPIELSWTRCVPGGCVADAAPREDLLKRWRALSEPGRVTFKNAVGQDVIMPISFRGLAQALDALAKER